MKIIHKFIFVFFVLIFTVSVSSAQKYKVKGETITKDDVVLGKAVGKSGLSNSNFVIYGLGGEKVISAYREEYKAPSKLYKDRYWYNVRFEDTGKEIFLPMAVEFSIKSVLNKTFPDAGIVFDGGLIKNQDDIISKYDIKDSILNDTTSIGAAHRQTLYFVKDNPLTQRDKKKLFTFNYISQEKINDTTFTRWDLYQDNVLIGSYLQRSKYLFNKDNYSYIVYRYIKDTTPSGMVPIAFGETDTFNAGLVNFYSVVDKRGWPITMTPGVSSGIISALIAANLL